VDDDLRILESVDAPVAPVVDDSPIVKKTPAPAPEKPKIEHVSALADEDDEDLPAAPKSRPDRAIEAAPETPAHADEESADGPVKTVDTDKPTVPEETDDGGMGWIIAGATGGGLVLLAAAGVGGYFLVDALTAKTGTVTVTPR
jgi:hypothetical protein